jgi:hypothetical protein
MNVYNCNSLYIFVNDFSWLYVIAFSGIYVKSGIACVLASSISCIVYFVAFQTLILLFVEHSGLFTIKKKIM